MNAIERVAAFFDRYNSLINVALFVLSIAALIIAFRALKVATDTLTDARDSGRDQTRILIASRDALGQELAAVKRANATLQRSLTLEDAQLRLTRNQTSSASRQEKTLRKSTSITAAALDEQIDALRREATLLEAAERSIEGVASAAAQQETIGRSSLALSRQEFSLQRTERAEALKKARERPQVDVTIESFPWDALSRGLPLLLNLDAANHVNVSFFMRNPGDAALIEPIIIVAANPTTVALSGGSPIGAGAVQFDHGFDLLPATIAVHWYKYRLEATPGPVRRFSLVFQVSGRNFAQVTRVFNFVVQQTPPTPTPLRSPT